MFNTSKLRLINNKEYDSHTLFTSTGNHCPACIPSCNESLLLKWSLRICNWWQIYKSNERKNLPKRMNIDTYLFTDFFFHFFFIDFDCHQLRPFFFYFKANIYFQRWETEIPSFLFFVLQLKSYGLKLYELLVGDPILSLEIQMRILHFFEFIHLWFLLMKYKWIKIETVSSLSLSNLTGNAKST